MTFSIISTSPEPAAMKKLIVVLNDLELTGKTTVARALAAYLHEQEISHLLVSTDGSDSEDFAQGEFWDLEDEIELSQLIGALDQNDAVIIDVSTGAARNWADFCEEQEVDGILAEMDVEMTLVIPEHGGERCHNEVVDLAEIFSDQADYVIVHLPLPARRSAESEWKGSYAAKATNFLGALAVTPPEIESDLETALESSGNDICSALGQLENLPRFLEVQVTQWLEGCSLEFNLAKDYLQPESLESLVSHEI